MVVDFHCMRCGHIYHCMIIIMWKCFTLYIPWVLLMQDHVIPKFIQDHLEEAGSLFLQSSGVLAVIDQAHPYLTCKWTHALLHLSICKFIHPSIYPSIPISVYLLYLSLYLPTYLSPYLSIYLFIPKSISLWCLSCLSGLDKWFEGWGDDKFGYVSDCILPAHARYRHFT